MSGEPAGACGSESAWPSVPERVQARKDITAVRSGDGNLTNERDTLQAISCAFSRSWGSHRPDSWLSALDYMLVRAEAICSTCRRTKSRRRSCA